MLTLWFCIGLTGCTVYTEKQSQAVSQSVYATKDSIDTGRFDLASEYINQVTRIIYPPKSRINIKPLYDYSSKSTNTITTTEPLTKPSLKNLFSIPFAKPQIASKPINIIDNKGNERRVVVVPEEYKNDKVVVVGTADYDTLTKNKTINQQLQKDNENFLKEKKTTDEEITKQAKMKDKMVNDLNKLQKELIQKNLAILWRNIIIVSLLVLIGVYFYAKANGLFFL